jgi:putative transport protein
MSYIAMSWFVELLKSNTLLLLFVVAAIGYPLGRVRLFGHSLGVAAVLFVGLAIGALDPDLKLPEVIYTLGLVVFVYTIGLSSGAGFFASFRRKGLRDNLLIVGMLIIAALAVVGVQYAFGLRPTVAAGLFAGSLTNTPALAAVLAQIKIIAPADTRDRLLADPVVGYSIAYPIGVIGMIITIAVLQRMWHVDYTAETQSLRDLGAVGQKLVNRTVRIMRPEISVLTVDELLRAKQWRVIFGRTLRNGEMILADGSTRLQHGDLVSLIGTEEEVTEAAAFLGEMTTERLELDRSKLDFRRIFVSNPQVVGRPLRDLQLPQRYGALVTRVRRGDMELLPHGDTVLELGDRVRVVALRERMDEVSEFFGDSYRALSEIDILTFSLGLAMGLLIGMIPIPLAGGTVFRLGVAGGPLVMALILGARERTGPLVWNIPYSANLTLRQIGLVLFLAGVGTRSGYAFVSTFTQSGGIALFGAGAGITCGIAFMTLWIGHKLLRIPMSLLIGMLAGLQTQPAVLAFALEQTKNDAPNIGYTTVYPMAMITKILLAQALVVLLR